VTLGSHQLPLRRQAWNSLQARYMFGVLCAGSRSTAAPAHSIRSSTKMVSWRCGTSTVVYGVPASQTPPASHKNHGITLLLLPYHMPFAGVLGRRKDGCHRRRRWSTACARILRMIHALGASRRSVLSFAVPKQAFVCCTAAISLFVYTHILI
jgi:hypothetical protein